MSCSIVGRILRSLYDLEVSHGPLRFSQESPQATVTARSTLSGFPQNLERHRIIVNTLSIYHISDDLGLEDPGNVQSGVPKAFRT